MPAYICLLPVRSDDEELQELAQGLSLDTRSVLFIPVNDSEEFFQGCTHWLVQLMSRKTCSSEICLPDTSLPT